MVFSSYFGFDNLYLEFWFGLDFYRVLISVVKYRRFLERRIVFVGNVRLKDVEVEVFSVYRV